MCNGGSNIRRLLGNVVLYNNNWKRYQWLIVHVCAFKQYNNQIPNKCLHS